MGSGVLFLTENSFCKEHRNIVKFGESECEVCKVISRNLSLKPPFDVICKRTFGGCKFDEKYVVIWTIKSGRSDNKDLCGYVFKAEKDNNLLPRVFDADDFLPWDFMTVEQKNKWESKEEKEEINESGICMGGD